MAAAFAIPTIAQENTVSPVELQRTVSLLTTELQRLENPGTAFRPASDTGWLSDPFKHLDQDMEVIESDLDTGETHKPAEVDQPRVLSRLDQLIEMLERKRRGGSGAAPPSPLAGANQSSLAPGPGGQGEMRKADDGKQRWAELTPKEREEILQSKTEAFPPGYESLLSEYFLRLASEQNAIQSEPERNAADKKE